ncbi:MAG: hypothetical protein IPK50_16435 [Fibrobacterota bacterium]|nr:hypothetical protein [Fibrobacterota bacterium]QQS03869.1 MAG: hypothetical protein IPK50_16435 [Fibrobacterota bacterium]
MKHTELRRLPSIARSTFSIGFLASLFLGLWTSGCSLPRHPPEFRDVKLDSPGTLFDDRIILFRKRLIQVTLCTHLPAIQMDPAEFQGQKADTSLWTKYWLHPELNQWTVRTTLSNADSLISDFSSLPDTVRPEMQGDMRDPMVCRVVWRKSIPRGIYNMKVELGSIDTTLAPFPAELWLFTPHYAR